MGIRIPPAAASSQLVRRSKPGNPSTKPTKKDLEGAKGQDGLLEPPSSEAVGVGCLGRNISPISTDGSRRSGLTAAGAAAAPLGPERHLTVPGIRWVREFHRVHSYETFRLDWSSGG